MSVDRKINRDKRKRNIQAANNLDITMETGVHPLEALLNDVKMTVRRARLRPSKTTPPIQ